MNNNRLVQSPFKFLFISFILIIPVLFFTACENFLQGEDVKDEITKTIEYNNAPSYTINVEALKGTGVIKTPATGEVEKKVTDVFPVRFEPSDDHKFIKWEAKFTSNESAADYVTFEDAENLETKVTFKKAPPAVIIIQPVCPPRLTYSFDLYTPDDPAKKYPKDSSIAFTFNQKISSGCLVDAEDLMPPATEFIAIQNLQPSEGSASTYFNAPEISGQRLIFRSDSSFGYIPVYNGQRMISVTIKKDKIWYVNEQYLNPVRVYLDTDISRTFYIGEETSAKTAIKYEVKQKDLKPIGTLKVTVDNVTDEADDKPHYYSVGKTLALRYQLPEGYAFKEWKFIDSKGNEFNKEDLKLTLAVPEEETSDRLILLNITIDNAMEEQISVVPELYDPRTIEFSKPEEQSGVLKVDNSALTQDSQLNSYAVGKSFNVSYKIADGYYFHDWSFKRTYDDENGMQKTDLISKADLEKYGLKIFYEEDADEKGYDKSTRIAQAKILIQNYSNDIISITPVCFEYLKLTNFNLNDAEKYYTRDSIIELTFNKNLLPSCKDKVSIKIPGLAENKTFSDYFSTFVLNTNKLTIYTKGGSVENLLPLGADGTNTISVLANANELYYEAVAPDGEKVKVGLESDMLYSYRINAQTNTKTQLQYILEESFPGTLKVDGEDFVNRIYSYSVGQSVSLRCKLNEGYSFYGWEYSYTYTDADGKIITEFINETKLNELGIEFLPDLETGENGYDKATRIVQVNYLINNFASGIVSIIPVCFQNLTITNFSLNDAETLYGRDSDIEVTFSAPIANECKDNYILNIPGLPEGKTSADYFDTAILNGNTLTIKAKNEDSSQLLPLLSTGINTVSLIFNTQDIYYKTSNPSGAVINHYLSSNGFFSYRINGETNKKAKLQFVIDNQDVGTFLVDGEYKNSNSNDYSIGKTISIRYKINDDYVFDGWNFSLVDENGNNTDYVITDENFNQLCLNLSFDVFQNEYGYDRFNGVITANITPLNKIDGVIQIHPIVELAPSTSITVTGNRGSFSPSSGSFNVKQNFAKTISFEPESNYEFIRWETYNLNTNAPLDEKQNYIYIDDIYSKSITYRVLQIPDEQDTEQISLGLRPVLASRPKVISNSPLNTGNVLRDNTIQVIFDNDMDKNSVYFTEPELTEKRNALGIDYNADNASNGNSLLYYSDANNQKVYYGYIKDGETYFKNIYIKNRQSGANLLSCFEAPLFERNDTLSIGIKRSVITNNGVTTTESLIPKYAQIIVTIGDDSTGDNFFYSIDDKPVKMSSSFAWYYQVSDKSDDEAPIIATDGTPIVKNGETELSILTTAPDASTKAQIAALQRFDNGNFNLKLKIDDKSNGSGVAPSFNVICQKVNNELYTSLENGEIKNIGTEYSYVAGQTADFDGECSLGNLTDGVYSMKFEFTDKSGNKLSYPTTGAYYFCIDKTGPTAAQNTMETATDTNANGKIKLTWNVANIKDYDKSIIHYKKFSDSGEQTPVTVENKTPDSSGNIDYTFNNLTPGTRYMFYAIHYDVWGNKAQQPTWRYAYTIPAVPKNVQVASDIYGTTARLTITKPDNGNCTGYEIRYGPTGTAESSWKTLNVPDASTSDIIQEITGLSNGVKYEFAVKTKDSNSEFISVTPYKSGDKYPSYSTIPAEPSFSGLPYYSSSETSIDYSYTTPNSPFTGIRLYYDTKDSFTSETYKVITDSVQNHTGTYTVTGLTAGTRYYLKLVAYFESENNKSETDRDWSITKPNPVNSISKGDITTNSVVLNWTKPQSGDYTGYRIYYKKSTDTNYPSTPQVTINDKSTVTYTLAGLEGGTTYNIKIHAFHYYSSSQSKESVASSEVTAQTYPNPATNIVAENLSTTSTKLTWTSPTGMCDDLYLYISANENFTDLIKSTKLSAGATSYTATGLTTGSTYYYKLYSRVYKYNDSTNLIYTESDTVICSTSINPVTNQTVSSYGANSITVNWTNPAEYDGIRVYTSSNSTFSIANSTLRATYTNKTTTSCTISSLSPNIYYYVYIVAYKFVDGSEKTAVVRLGQRTLAATVQSISAEVTSPTSVEVTWKNPVSSSNWNYSRLYVYQGSTYVTYYSPSKGTQNASQTYTVSNLTPGTSYTFSVRTYNDSGYVNNSYSTVTKTTTPAPVTNFRVTNTTTTGPTLEWTLPEGNFTGLTIYRKTDSGTWTTSATISDKTKTSQTYNNSSVFTAGKDYVFKVATNLTGVTNLSDGSSETGTVTAHIRPNAPTNLTCSSRNTNSITVSWTNPANYTGVRLYYKANSASTYSYVNIAKGESSYKLTGLTAGTKYDVYLMSYNYSTSYYTNTSTMTTCTTPATVTGLTASAYNGGTKISWNASSGNKDYYAVYYKLSSSSSWYCASNTVSSSSTSYTFSNSALTNNSYYNFKVVGRTYSSSTDSHVESSDYNTVSFYAPPAGLSNVSLYSDDGMGTVRVRFYTSASSTNVDVFVNGSYIGCDSYSGSGYKYYTAKIPDYYRGNSYEIRIAPYHSSNSSPKDPASWAQAYSNETYGTSVTVYASTTGSLVIKGTTYSYSKLLPVINKSAGSYTVNKNSNGTDGAFTKNRVVTLSPYTIGQYEVTQELFYAVMGYNPTSVNYNSSSYYPVASLRWYDAIAFCNKLSALQGLTPCYTISGIDNSWWENATVSRGNYSSNASYIYVPTSSNASWNDVTLNQNANGYHLPTECQWEFAARGGVVNGYAWSYNFAGNDSIGSYGWYVNNSNGTTHTVGGKLPNSLQLYDMTGNVYEWTTDWNNSVPSGTFTNPWCGYSTATTSTTVARNSNYGVLLKGGSYNRGDSYCKNQRNDYYYDPASDNEARIQWGMRLCRNVSY